MYVGNVYPFEDNLGFKDVKLGWNSLYNESLKDVTLKYEKIQNLVYMVFLQSLNTKEKIHYNKFEYKDLAASYPLGQCLR